MAARPLVRRPQSFVTAVSATDQLVGRGRRMHHEPPLQLAADRRASSTAQPIHNVTRGSAAVGRQAARQHSDDVDASRFARRRPRPARSRGSNDTGPVTSVHGLVYCAPDSSAGWSFDDRRSAPLSSNGDARIRQSRGRVRHWGWHLSCWCTRTAAPAPTSWRPASRARQGGGRARSRPGRARPAPTPLTASASQRSESRAGDAATKRSVCARRCRNEPSNGRSACARARIGCPRRGAGRREGAGAAARDRVRGRPSRRGRSAPARRRRRTRGRCAPGRGAR